MQKNEQVKQNHLSRRDTRISKASDGFCVSSKLKLLATVRDPTRMLSLIPMQVHVQVQTQVTLIEVLTWI
jgi:hypothetical protein